MRSHCALLFAGILFLATSARADDVPPDGPPRPKYKLGESWPLRNFNGLDLFEPLVPMAAISEGDSGRIVFGTAIPHILLIGAFVLEETDKENTQGPISTWDWLSLDKGQDNLPTLWALMAVSGASLFLPAPEDGTVGDGDYNWDVRADRATVFALGIGVSALETSILKKVFDRPRPSGHSNASRPSGHATTAWASAAFLSDVLRDTLEPQDEDDMGTRLLEEAVCALPYLPAAYISLERVYAQRHYLSDVFLGAAIGAFTMHMFYSWSFTRDELGRSWIDGLSVVWDPTSHDVAIQLAWSF